MLSQAMSVIVTNVTEVRSKKAHRLAITVKMGENERVVSG